jgi:hypothetical protein
MAKIYGGRWRCIEQVGGGGQSQVYKVEDTTSEFEGVHALKRLKRMKRSTLMMRKLCIGTSGQETSYFLTWDMKCGIRFWNID